VGLLLVSGSLRTGSTNTEALRAIAGARPSDVLYDGIGALPHFDPDLDVDPVPPAVAELRAAIATADGVLFCTPEYAGELPGSFKNLLDWTVGGGEIYEKPVGWINVAAEGRGAGAHAALRIVLGYVGARIVDDACAAIAVPRTAVDADTATRLVAVADALSRAGGARGTPPATAGGTGR